MERYAPSESGGGTDAVELRRYRNALGRNWLLILAIVVPMTALVFVVSLRLPPTYRSSATIVLGDEGVIRAGGNPELVERALETAERLAITRPVLSAAARRLGGGSVEALSEKVSASASAEANLVRVTAEDGDAAGAARIANAVVVAFLAEKVADEGRALAAVRRNLLRQIARLKGTGRKGEIAALRVRLHEVAVNEADAGGGLARADCARPAERPDSPRVLQNTLFALFGFTFLAILGALAREQIAPRVRDAGELAGLIETPLLVEMPTPRRWSTSRKEGAAPAYELLHETVQTLLPPGDVQTVLVTSSHRERATADIAAGLADALARAGESSVLVGEIPGVDRQAPPSLSVLLHGLDEGSEDVEQLLERAEIRPELLVVSPDGDAPLRSRAQIETLAGGLSRYGIRYVVVVGRPLLVSRDGPLLPRLVDGVLLVCRPGITTRDDADRLRQLLRASDANVLGVVSLGARQFVPYEVRVRATEHGLV